MELDELAGRINNLRRLEELEQRPSTPFDPAADMDSIPELKNYVRFLYGRLQDEAEAVAQGKQEMSELKTRLDESLSTIAANSRTISVFSGQIEILTGQLKDATARIAELTRLLETQGQRLAVVNSEHYGTSKSKKGTGRNKVCKGKNDDRHDFDGNAPVAADAESKPDMEEPKPVYHGPSRKGCKYNKQVVGEPIVHKCDRSKLPEGAVVIGVMKPKVVRDLVCHIEEHHFERLKVRYADGSVHVVYLPKDDDDQACLYDEIVPGTGVTVNLLSFLIFNRYQMCTPAYREAGKRLAGMDWDTCRQNLLNWADKGAVQLNKLIPALKNAALTDGANVNVDETWCRYQTHFGHRKVYLWCLVNRKAGIVIFFFENTDGHSGGRGRSVLTEFLEDRHIKSLQSDGYNVYMYLDNELLDVEHLCCLAHARAKMKDAQNQGCEKADFFIGEMGKLYAREDLYRKLGYSEEKIRGSRNDGYTTDIIAGMRKRLTDLLAKGEGEVSDLMWKAMTYLDKFWKNIFAYRKDGAYTIDNLVAERAIRNLTVQRKNSLFFCSVKGAVNSAIYNTFIETCRLAKVSFMDYLRTVLRELNKGRTDYENLLPSTIPLKSR